MEKDIYPQIAALAHPQRLALFALLMRRYPDRLPAGEIGATLGARPSTLSAWLTELSEAGLIDHERRGTSLLYRARLDRVQDMVDTLLGDCCRGRADGDPAPKPGRVRNILFLCSGNSARSLMAEALMRDIAGRRFEAFSAGTQARDEPNPQAMAMLRELGHDTAALWSKPADPFWADDAPRMDIVLTVCDRAANHALPAFPGRPVQGHWGLPDPVAAGSAEAYADTYLTLRNRITRLAALPPDLTRGELMRAMDDLASVGPQAE